MKYGVNFNVNEFNEEIKRLHKRGGGYIKSKKVRIKSKYI